MLSIWKCTDIHNKPFALWLAVNKSLAKMTIVHLYLEGTMLAGHRHKMVQCSDTRYPICLYVHIQQTELVPTAFKVCEWHHACVPCSIYLLDYCFLRFLCLFHVMFLYETVKRPNRLRRLATISADCHGNLRCHFKKIECFPYWTNSSSRESSLENPTYPECFGTRIPSLFR